MRKVVLIDKKGTVNTKQVKNCRIETLYKKCKCKTNENFEQRHTWPHGNNYISLYARDEGRANTENKYDLPPPLDTVLYFGTMICVGHTKKTINNEELVDITKEDWLVLYEKLFGGFEDLHSGMESSEDELKDIDPDLKTSAGYLKDGFVVDDDDDDDDDDYALHSNDESDAIENSEDEEAYYGKETDDEDYSDDDEDDNENESDEEGDDNNSELSEEEYSY